MGNSLISLFESFEPRRLLAVTLESGLLKITGTPRAELIILQTAPDPHLALPFPAQIAVNFNL